MPINTAIPGFNQVTPFQLQVAELFFTNNPKETFLSRKKASILHLSYSGIFQNSFIYDQEQKILYVKEDTHTPRDLKKENYYLGSGTFGQVKYVQDINGTLYALKISNPESHRDAKTFNIMKNLRKLFFTAQRHDSHTAKPFFEKKYYKQNIKEYQILKFEPGQRLWFYLIGDQRSSLTLIDRLSIAIATTKELVSLHQNGIIHGDLSTSNIMVDFHVHTNINVGIIDYDRSIQLYDRSKSISGQIYLYADYLPPEITSGMWSQKVDIYSLGTALLGRSLNQDGLSIKDNQWYLFLTSEISQDLLIIINRMISKDPSERPTAEEVLLSLTKELTQITRKRDRENLEKQKYGITLTIESYIKSKSKNFYYYFSKIFSFLSNRAKRMDLAEQLITTITKINGDALDAPEKINNALINYQTMVLSSRHWWEKKSHEGQSEKILKTLDQLRGSLKIL